MPRATVRRGGHPRRAMGKGHFCAAPPGLRPAFQYFLAVALHEGM